ncbi:cytoplasmic tRNA 2-thiolation protein 2-A-like [Oppia nitens]|uniref:cytoplasmic tRNA 2-thiolation protein 2-A-like n=1 Tax=Oppia nitens TaxID=1686743 RepID=UPI0023DA479C|nr:cytoplasmic tRNA 2-thiolation protein 2-A-like [Oppia nitens]
MCDNINTYSSSDTIYKKFLETLKRDGVVKCKKCQINDGFVLLQRKDVFCRQCLANYCAHKFRSTIGKSKAIQREQRIIIAFSGGVNSSAMIDLIKDGLNEDQHRRLRFVPSLVYIDDRILRQNESIEEQELIFKEITNIMIETNWDCYVSSIEMSYRQNNDIFYTKINNQINKTSVECQKTFSDCFSSITSLTSKQEFIKQMRTRLIVDIAANEKFDKIFMANNATHLGINLLSDVAIGKGIQLQSEAVFVDERQEVPILRPMRELTAKEITFYAIMKNLKFVITKTLTTNTSLKSSLQRMSESFVNGLQSEFPATLYTIMKTGDKLKVDSDDTDSQLKCSVCSSIIDTINRPKCSAYETLRLTNYLSNNSIQNPNDMNSLSLNTSNILPQLCYSCNIIANEMSNETKFPKNLSKKLI